MDPQEQFRKTFFEECHDLLGTAEGLVTELAAGDDDPDRLNAIFRAVHSIKGGAGAFGFSRLVAFAHILETLLDRLRNRQVVATREMSAVILRSIDALADLVRAEESGVAADDGLEASLAQSLRIFAGDAGDLAAQPAIPVAASPAGGELVAQERHFQIHFQPNRDLIRNANEPLNLLRELARMGKADIAASLAALPPLDAIDPEDIYLSWNIDLVTSRSADDVREVFEFVSDDCRLDVIEIQPSTSGLPLTRPDPDLDVSLERRRASDRRRAGDDRGENTGWSGADRRGSAGNSIRVDLEKVDALVNLVGELVTTQAMLTQATNGLRPDQHLPLFHALDGMLHHIRELQDCVMAVRAQPVKAAFSRLPKLVRDIAGMLGKEASLVMEGESTEIDKTIIEQLGDPLTHMIRNAIDHGIETPDERLAAGKPASGTIMVSAQHLSGRIVIEIIDDGRGIDRQKLLAKARDKGVVGAGENLSDDEIDNLIFAPGLSTAAKISDVSGRGVGMDVVKRNIEAINGRVVVTSRPGQGCRFTLSLPLTLAVMDGMVVSVGSEIYIIPITSIIESLRPKSQDLHAVVGSSDVLAVRGEYVPLVYLYRLFAVADAVTDPSQGIVVLVEGDQGKLGVVVDMLHAQQQVVVKSLEANYQKIPGISAATILGDGKVALILDIAALNALGSTGRTQAKILSMPAISSEIH